MGSEAPISTEAAAPASAGFDDWRARLRAMMYALYRERAALLVGAGTQDLADLLDEGRAEPSAPTSLTRVTAEALGGAIFHQLCFAASRESGLPPESELLPRLMYSAVLPYAGEVAAAEELRLPPPR
jgi:hypothetical protein